MCCCSLYPLTIYFPGIIFLPSYIKSKLYSDFENYLTFFYHLLSCNSLKTDTSFFIQIILTDCLCLYQRSLKSPKQKLMSDNFQF